MLNFKEMLEDMVSEVQKEMAHEEYVEMATSDEYMANELLLSDNDKSLDILSGYDRKYISRNDYRVAHKIRNASTTQRENEDAYFSYLFASAGYEPQQKEHRINASYDFNMEHIGLPWVKKTSKSVASTAAIKKSKTGKRPASTYIVEDKKVYCKKFKPSLNTDTVIVKDFYIFKEMVILEVERKFDVNTRIYRREYQAMKTQDEVNFHIVFRYEPVDEFGRPNENCGLRQLFNILHDVPAVMQADVHTLVDALRASIGCTLEVKDIPVFEYASETVFCKEVVDKATRKNKLQNVRVEYDKRTMYKFYGDIEFLLDAMPSKKYHEYQKISEYELRTHESFGYEQLKPEIYAKTTKFGSVISYDCHKELSAQLPLMYNHIDAIFD